MIDINMCSNFAGFRLSPPLVAAIDPHIVPIDAPLILTEQFIGIDVCIKMEYRPSQAGRNAADILKKYEGCSWHYSSNL